MAAVVLLGGCAVGGGDDEEDAGAFPEKLAEPAQPLTIEAGGTSTTVTSPTDRPTTTTRPTGETTTSTSRSSGTASTSPTTTTTLRPFRQVMSVVDRAGDAGIQARPYGDLSLLRLEDDGTQARVTVQLYGDLPVQPADGEVIGIGVDFFHGGKESDHQLFALGNADGWRAALQAGDDWVEYPGRFELGGNTLVFVVPWSSLGGRRAGTVSVFADWSRARVAVVADESSDRSPDQGDRPYSF